MIEARAGAGVASLETLLTRTLLKERWVFFPIARVGAVQQAPSCDPTPE
jgi:hypothetical protein